MAEVFSGTFDAPNEQPDPTPRPEAKRSATNPPEVGVLSSSGMRSTIGDSPEAQAAQTKTLRQPNQPTRRLHLRRDSDALRVTDDERTTTEPHPPPHQPNRNPTTPRPFRGGPASGPPEAHHQPHHRQKPFASSTFRDRSCDPGSWQLRAGRARAHLTRERSQRPSPASALGSLWRGQPAHETRCRRSGLRPQAHTHPHTRMHAQRGARGLGFVVSPRRAPRVLVRTALRVVGRRGCRGVQGAALPCRRPCPPLAGAPW